MLRINNAPMIAALSFTYPANARVELWKYFDSVDMATIPISIKILAFSYGFRARPLVNVVI